MAEQLLEPQARTDLLNRLRRAEGQLRGVQRMIEEGQPVTDVANQMAAVRKALDSTQVRMTVCFVRHELNSRFSLGGEATGAKLDGLMEEMQELLSKVP